MSGGAPGEAGRLRARRLFGAVWAHDDWIVSERSGRRMHITRPQLRAMAIAMEGAPLFLSDPSSGAIGRVEEAYVKGGTLHARVFVDSLPDTSREAREVLEGSLPPRLGLAWRATLRGSAEFSYLSLATHTHNATTDTRCVEVTGK